MKYVTEFQDPKIARRLLDEIRETVRGFQKTMIFMEVCGTHTMSVCRHGIRSLLPDEIRLVSGPGCPVCVSPVGYVDQAAAMARQPGLTLATFGDMVRVPSSSGSLLREQGLGADVKIVYSPLDALALARKNPDRVVVFLGIGFETTAPAVAGTILRAREERVDNFLVLSSHKTMPVPMALLAGDPELEIGGFLCPAHVSAVIGADAYLPLARDYKIPCVVTGFEPLDILQGTLMLARQVVSEKALVENQYSRAVKSEGNLRARRILDEVFEPCDVHWRGLGMIPGSGLRIREEFADFDAYRRIPVNPGPPREPAGCLCGDVLKGKISPWDCPLFGRACTPEDPVGPCMVSGEGACAAAYRYGR